MISLHYFHQRKSYTCGPASLKMVFDFFGLKTSEEKLKKYLKSNKEKGTKHKALINAVIRNGFYCYVHNHSSLSQIKGFIEKDLPVIIHYIEPDSNEEHYSVVVGVHGRKIIMNDPWMGKRFKLKEKEFERRWHGEKNYGWLMVLSRKKFDLGKQYNPK